MGNRQTTVTTSIIKIVAWNGKRTALSITNASGAQVWISDNPSNPTGDGIPLDVGGTVEFSYESNDDPRSEKFAATLAGTATLSIQESNATIPADKKIDDTSGVAPKT